MKLIPLEEVEKIWRLNHTPELMVVHQEGRYILLNNIYYIPTIDPISIIDEMIEELNPEGFIPSNTDSIVTSYLREAKERIKKIRFTF